jgi:hypothetical protein
MNLRQKVAVGVLDVLVLVELCVSIYFANRSFEDFTGVFFSYFFSMVIPTLIIAGIVIKRLRPPDPDPGPGS